MCQPPNGSLISTRYFDSFSRSGNFIARIETSSSPIAKSPFPTRIEFLNVFTTNLSWLVAVEVLFIRTPNVSIMAPPPLKASRASYSMCQVSTKRKSLGSKVGYSTLDDATPGICLPFSTTMAVSPSLGRVSLSFLVVACTLS